MSFQRGAPYREPDPSPDSRLTALHAELTGLIELKAAGAVQVAQDYCALAEHLGDALTQAQGHYLHAQALMQGSEWRPALAAACLAAQRFSALALDVWHARAKTLAGKISFGLGDLDAADQQLREAISLVRNRESAEEKAVHATALNHLGAVQFNRNDVGGALVSLETALEIWILLLNSTGQINCLTNIGSIQSAIGQFDAAIRTLSRAYKINQTGDQDILCEGYILLSLARAHCLNTDYPLAMTVAQSALTAAREGRDTILVATALLNVGTISAELRQYPGAAAYLGEAIEISRKVGYRSGERSGLDSLGLLHHKLGDLQRAGELYGGALAIALELEEAQGELEARLHLASVELSRGNLAAAEAQVARSLALATESESPTEEAEAHRILAELGQRQGDYRRAFVHTQEQLRIKDGLFNTERDRQTRNLSIQFEVERARHDANVYRVRTEVEQEARRAAEELVQERTAELARAHHEVVTRLAMAAEYRDDTTGEHTRRVGRTAARIARGLGWPDDQAWILGIAARLHDVGKIGIPDSILLKTGMLTAAEYEHMKSHTLIGSRILSGGRSELLRVADVIALTHHERWDGSGYPRGLAGEQIPLTGRIVALADVFDALTQARPYKQAWTTEAALAEIQAQAGSHFDPLIVETALRVLAPDSQNAAPDELPLGEEDTAQILSVFEQVLVERTRDLNRAGSADGLAGGPMNHTLGAAPPADGGGVSAPT